MKKWLLLPLLLAFAMPASASLSIKDYRSDKAAGGQIWEQAKVYVAGVGSGLEWANTELQRNGMKVLFCEPNLALNAQNFLDILDRTLTEATLDEKMPIDAVLAEAMVRAFPCK
jgi:hypothetical protein